MRAATGRAGCCPYPCGGSMVIATCAARYARTGVQTITGASSIRFRLERKSEGISASRSCGPYRLAVPTLNSCDHTSHIAAVQLARVNGGLHLCLERFNRSEPALDGRHHRTGGFKAAHPREHRTDGWHCGQPRLFARRVIAAPPLRRAGCGPRAVRRGRCGRECLQSPSPPPTG